VARGAVIAAATLAAAAGVGQWLGRAGGSTRIERRRPMPLDGVVPQPTVTTCHGITIPAPPEEVWPWLAQMGWHRAGWYTYRWVDRALFPANLPSAQHLIPELQFPLSVGDRIPDGPPDTAYFVVAHVDPPRLLVLHSTTHVPVTWRARFGAAINWLWTFSLEEQDGGTRLVLRTRGRTAPWWLTAGYLTVLVPADFVMAGSMLRGIRDRVMRERVAAAATGTAPDRTGS
jgi:hypothetical protein